MALQDLAWYVNYGNGSSTGYYGVATFPATTTVAAGAIYRQLTAPAVGSELCFVVTTGGLTTTEPTWKVTRGALNTSGTAVFQECTGVPGLNGDTTNTPAWLAYKNANVTLGAVIYDSGTASLQICTVSGTAGNGSTPGFSTTAGTTTADNGATWTSLGLASGFTTAFAAPHARLANAFAATWGIAGNQFAVSSIHAETQASSIALLSPGTATAPCSIVCISNTTTLAAATLATTATIAATGASNIKIGQGSTTTDYSSYYGVQFLCASGSSAGTLFVNNTNQGFGFIYFDNCIFKLNTTASSAVIDLNVTAGYGNSCGFEIRNSSLIFGGTAQKINIGTGLHGFVNCTFAGSGSVPATLFTNNGIYPYVILRDSDLSAITGTLFNQNTVTGIINLQNCKLGSGVILAAGAGQGPQGSYFKVHNCDSTTTNYRYYFTNFMGTAQQETTHIRTGGATNGTTGISWNITPTANAKMLQPFVSEELEIWNTATGSAMTATCYLNTASTLYNDTFWIEIEYLSQSGNPLGATVNTRMTLLGSHTQLTTDTSTWGSAVANIYSVTSPSFTPQMAGPIKMRIYVGAASSSNPIYVDPKIYLSTTPTISRTYFVPGWGMVNELSTGGGGSGGTPVLQSAIIQGLGAI